MDQLATLSYSAVIDADMDQARQRAVDALKEQGFGVLTEIDVQAVLKEKTGEDIGPYIILGACNPRFAHQALTAAPDVGLLLPCNVIVHRAEPGKVRVAAVNPMTMLSVIPDDALKDVADQVSGLLEKAVASLK
jgi:uncharacterized protein (DUF302 family)